MRSLYDGKYLVLSPKRREDKDTYFWTARIDGIDLGGKVTLHNVQDDRVVLKVSGHSSWVGLGLDPEYIPAHYLIFKTSGQPTLDRSYPTRIGIDSFIHEFPVKSQTA